MRLTKMQERLDKKRHGGRPKRRISSIARVGSRRKRDKK